MTLQGRVALVTGAARGIGLAISRRLAAGGGRVARADSGRAAAAPPRTCADSIPPNPDIWRVATSWPGCVASPG